MIRAARCGALFLGLLLLGASGTTPEVVLQQYTAALARLDPPLNMTFVYSVEQSGTPNIEETHRVYRSGSHRRDETLSVDGIVYKQPRVSVFNQADRYDVTRLAPAAPAYTFTFAGELAFAGAAVYEFRTDLQSVSAYSVTSVAIDAVHFLPREIRFASARGSTKGNGRVTFGPQGRYWLPREASVEVRDAAGKISRERIVWSRYGFPDTLPASTFLPPHAPATPTP